MGQNKTRQTDAEVAGYLAGIEPPSRRQDCETLVELMSTLTRQPARMWGASIVGFGVHHYRYDSGREGDICAVGFSSRKAEIAIYGLDFADPSDDALARLGKHKTGKGCLYVKRLADVDLDVLSSLLQAAAGKRMSTGA